VYTQCPDCATVFRVTAEALRVAQGDVRCGVCSTSFNALENLSEQAFRAETTTDAGSADDSMTVEELPGGENIELSAQPPDAARDAEPEPAAEAAGSDEDRALEFHGDAAVLERLFVVETPEIARFDPGGGDETASSDLDSTDEHPILVLDEQDELPEEAAEAIVLESPEPEPAPAVPPPLRVVPPPSPALPLRAAEVTVSHTAPRILIPDEMRRRLAEEAEARVEAESLFEPIGQSMPLLERRWPWVAGVAALALLFAVQVVHAHRNDLVKSAGLGPVVAGTYALLGLSLLTPTDLSAYELRQWGAASDPNQANRLMLRASIVNRASFAQPFPLLRLALQDRFGGTIGLRDIGPADYLPGSGPPGLLEPGQRADALIRIVDPGAEAVGFELDVCLPTDGGVRCANPVPAAAQ
jgi:predicted Zn finger-like uncharacterized protein